MVAFCSAFANRVAARSRVGAKEITLASMGSYCVPTTLPVSTPESTLMYPALSDTSNCAPGISNRCTAPLCGCQS
ncbi:unannotated protein [freshwater metagenome]|uniref:Unannotated protein n=1 Tax=freshwater metagenome TaxID=449393 RepID=A0A6J7H000_9ZZZZ